MKHSAWMTERDHKLTQLVRECYLRGASDSIDFYVVVSQSMTVTFEEIDAFVKQRYGNLPQPDGAPDGYRVH